MPSKPKSPMGEMAAYYLAMQPHLFQEAVQRAFAQLREQRDADAAAAAAKEEAAEAARKQGDKDAGAELVLYQRMAQVRSGGRRHHGCGQPSLPASGPVQRAAAAWIPCRPALTPQHSALSLAPVPAAAQVKRLEQLLAIEDLMYVCILEKFRVGGCRVLGAGCLTGVGRLGGQQVARQKKMWLPRCQCQLSGAACGVAVIPHRSSLAAMLPCPALPAAQEVGVDMLPRMEPVPEQPETLKALTGGRVVCRAVGEARWVLGAARLPACSPAWWQACREAGAA